MLTIRAVTFGTAAMLACVTGCDDKSSGAASNAPDKGGEEVKLVGVDLDRWTCDLIATPATISELLGIPARGVDSTLGSAPGTPKPCNFVAEGAAPEAWSFDFDCRDNALKTAEKLFTEYTERNQALIEQWDASTGGKVQKDDAGVEQHAVAAPVEVQVGKKALDHHGQAILFIDDDTPCYARVAGPDPERRLLVAKLVAQKLTPATAPMRPRPAADLGK
ncbi:MAG TPA: hypothetical protein VM261_29740 [Kofleriaceae bacterium]|nr:hypothetical protein [Kofleriaceae bacterium]